MNALVMILAILISGDDETTQSDRGQAQLGNPPRVVLVRGIDDQGRLNLVEYRTIYIGFDGSSYNSRSESKLTLKDVVIEDLKGDGVSVEQARERLGDTESPILVLSYREPVAELYRGMYIDSTLVFRFPKKAPEWREIQDPSRPVRR